MLPQVGIDIFIGIYWSFEARMEIKNFWGKMEIKNFPLALKTVLNV